MKRIRFVCSKSEATFLLDSKSITVIQNSGLKWLYDYEYHRVYANVRKPDKTYALIYLHRWLVNAESGQKVVHLNGDKYDLRLSNLHIKGSIKSKLPGKEKKDVNELSDLDLIEHYQQTGRDEYYNVMLKRYSNSIKKRSGEIFSKLPDDMGLDYSDIYLETMVYFQKAMIFVKRCRITDESKFSFNFVFKKYCQSYRNALIRKHYNRKIKETVTDKVDHHVSSINVSSGDYYKEFVNQLTKKERKIFDELLGGNTTENIANMFGLNSGTILEIKSQIGDKYRLFVNGFPAASY